jgi:hypothetical protein
VRHGLTKGESGASLVQQMRHVGTKGISSGRGKTAPGGGGGIWVVVVVGAMVREVVVRKAARRRMWWFIQRRKRLGCWTSMVGDVMG